MVSHAMCVSLPYALDIALPFLVLALPYHIHGVYNITMYVVCLRWTMSNVALYMNALNCECSLHIVCYRSINLSLTNVTGLTTAIREFVCNRKDT